MGMLRRRCFSQSKCTTLQRRLRSQRAHRGSQPRRLHLREIFPRGMGHNLIESHGVGMTSPYLLNTSLPGIRCTMRTPSTPRMFPLRISCKWKQQGTARGDKSSSRSRKILGRLFSRPRSSCSLRAHRVYWPMSLCRLDKCLRDSQSTQMSRSLPS